jgi:SAM-dependent methyltransferase
MMAQDRETDPTYVLGRSSEETQRLTLAFDLLRRFTRQVFIEAGITPGMRVLDLGSGAGDVAFLVAEIVGPTGEVVGIDLNATILEVAEQRARDRGFANVSFTSGDIRTLELDGAFDAVVGRLVLCYLKEPAAGLQQALRYLKPGGVVAQIEVDVTVPVDSRPASELYQTLYRWAVEAFRRGGVELNMAMRLPEVFHRCGLPSPQLQMGCMIGSGPEFAQQFAVYAAGLLRSLLPRLVEYGIATEQEVGIETLATRFAEQFGDPTSIIRWFLYVGAWSTKS